MILEMSALQLLFLPPVLLVVSGLALYNFQCVFRFLTRNLKSYMTLPAVQFLKPYADNLKYALEKVLGNASTLKFDVSHVLLMAILLILVAIYNAIQSNNRLQAQYLRLKTKRK